MKKEYLQPFLKATGAIAEKFFGSEFTQGNMSLEKTLFMEKDIIVALGIKGQLNGIVLFGMTNEEAKSLSSSKLALEGMPGYTEWDELSESVLLEFGNQVLGYVTELYGEKGIVTDITTPNFIRKEQLKNYGKESIRFEVQNGMATIIVKVHVTKK